MKDSKDLPPDVTELRRQAEERIAAETIPPEELSPNEAARLIHELRVHQIELEMQNDELRRSQSELEESRTRYADLYDFAPVGYLTLDRAGKIVEANLTAGILLGVERSKLLGRFFPHFLVEADRRVFRQLMNNGLNLKKRRGEFHLQDGGGNVRAMLLDILFLTDTEGQECRRVSFTDITELKHVQEEPRLHQEDLEELVAQRMAELIETNEELRRTNENLEALFAAAPLAIAEFDAEGKVTRINLACERMYGWRPEEVMGRLPLSIPEEAPEESLELLQGLLNGESVTGAEIKQKRKDGSLFDASVFGAPLYDAQGKVRGFVGLAEDITERKKLEENVPTQAQVLAQMAEGVAVTDQRGEIFYTNPAFDAMFGYEPGELAGKHSNVLNFYPPEENIGLVKEILDRVKRTGLWTGEFRNCKKDGKPFFTSVRISSVEVGGKKLYISVQEDITRSKKTRETLQRQAELLDLAHDAILVRDTRGRITYWNQGAAHHYGWTQAEAMGQISRQLLKTAFPQPLLEIERHLLEHGFWEGELTHTTQQGKEVVMNSRWTAKRDETGHIVAILEINQDITVQKQVEQEIHRLASFPLLNPNPVAEVDEDGHITYTNPAARQAVEELRLAEGAKAFVPPDLKEKFAAVGQGGPRQYTFDLSLKEKRYAVNLSFAHDLPTARLYALDITERERAQAALRRSEERFRRLVEANVVGLAVSEEDRVVEANDEFLRLAGHTRKQMLAGKVKWVEIIPREDIPQEARSLYELRTAGAHPPYETNFVRRDGSRTPVVLGGALLEEEPLSWVSFVLDISERKHLEDSLRVSEARFRAIFANASIGIATTDLSGRLQEFNAPVIKSLGYTPTELKGMDFREITHPDDLAMDQKLFTELAEGRQDQYQVEKRFVHKDGRVLWGRVHVSLVRKGGGEPYFTVSLVEDITNQKESQAALEESEARYRSLVELSPDAIIVHSRGRYVFANPAALKLFGAAGVEDILSQRVLELVHPDSHETVRRRVEAEESLDLREVKILRLDGQTIEVEVTAAPIHYLGQPAVQVVLRDITERKAAEAALAKSQAELKAIFNSITDGAVFADPERHVVLVNPAAEALFGYSQEEMQGRLGDFVYASREDFEEQGRLRYHTRPEQPQPVYEITYRRKDGSVFPAESRGSQVKDPEGRVLGFVTIHRDISERKAAEEALRTSEAQLKTILDSLTEGLVVADLNGYLFHWNPAAVAMHGFASMEECRRRLPDFADIFELSTIEDGILPMEQWPLARILRGETLEGWEVHVRRRDIDWQRIFSYGGTLARDPEGQPLLAVVTVGDITERHQAEEALRERETRLTSLFAAAPVGIGLMVDRVIMQVNQRLCQMTGYAPEELLGKSSRILYPTQEDFDYVGQEKYRQIGEIGVGTVETRWQRKDGVIIEIFLSSAPLISGDTSLGVTFTALDITERKEAEEALTQSEARYRAVGELIPFGIWTAAPDGSWEYVSKSFLELTGKTLAECQGSGWMSLLPQEDIKPTREARLQSLETEGFWDYEHKIRGQDGGWRTVLSRGVPLTDSQGRITSWVGINLDISDRKKMEEALRRAYDQMEELVEKRTAALRRANESLRSEIEERQKMEERLRDSEARFTAFMEHLPGLAVMRDMEGRYLFANRTWEETMGLTPGAWEEKTLDELWDPERAQALHKSDFEIISSGKPTEEVEVQVLADGPHHFLTKRFPILDERGLPYMVGAVAIDVTDRQRAEQQVAETGRLYRVLSQVNEAILRGRDQETLFEQVCRIAVEEGLFRLAWVGLTDPGSQTVRVAGKYGFDEGYLDNLAIPVVDGPESQGPTGTAVRCNRLDICNDFAADPRMAPWRVLALDRGYRSSGAFPLRVGEKVVGAITLYASRPEFFTEKEIELLTSLADNLSFALESLDREDKRRQAEEALATERQRLFDLLENLPAYVYLQAQDYSVPFANREFRERFGEPDSKTCYALKWGKDEPCLECPTRSIFDGHLPKELEWTASDGRIYHAYNYPFLDVDGSPLVMQMGIDITYRKRAEEALAEQAMLIQDLYNNAPCGYHSLDSEGYFAQINDTELAWLGYTREELVGRQRFSDLMTPDSRKLFEETFPVFKARGWVKDLEYELVRRDGTFLPVVLNATVVTDEAGNYLLSRSTIFDITERKKAEEALKESEQRLRYLAEQLLAAQENERKRLAAELHDELGHALLALKLHLSSIEKKLPPEQEGVKKEIRGQLDYINEVIQDVRRLYHDLSPGDLEDLGLTKALGTLINDFAGHFPQVNWQVDLADMVGLFSLPVQTTIYRIIQEALTNIGKHAHPTRVIISAQKEPDHMHFVVQDNGTGFNVQDLSSRREGRGLGLAALEERLKMVGGSFEIQSREQEGTRLNFTIPIFPEGEKP
jgi:PAS domain S-box-containing protein